MKTLCLAIILLATVAWAEPATINREGQLVWSGETEAVQSDYQSLTTDELLRLWSEQVRLLQSLRELIAENEPVLPSGIVITGVTYRDKTLGTVEIKDLITILEQARPHVWSIPYNQFYTQGIYDPCTSDPICMAQREVDKMRERKALAERIDEVVRILREANK